MTALAGWQNFYVIVGSSAGALIGLQFVVLTLISDMPASRGSAQAGHAFATPTIVHFGTVLLLSAALTAPWQGISSAAVLWGLVGLIGVIYALIVAWRMRDTNLVPASVRRLAVSFAPAACVVRHVGSVGLRDALLCARGSVCRRSGGVAAALHRHSQRLGRRHLPRVSQ